MVNRTDPYRSHRFTVEIEGLVAAGFSQIDGLQITAGVRTDRADGDPERTDDSPHRTERRESQGGGFFSSVANRLKNRARESVAAATRPGDWIDADDWPAIVNWTEPGESNPPPAQRRGEYPLLELTRGVTDSRELETWLANWIEGTAAERDVRIFLLDTEGSEARGWHCRGAVPIRWSGPELLADRSGVATETLALAHAGISPLNVEEG